MKKISFVIYGEPMGKQRPKFSTAKGFVRTYTPSDTLDYESKVRYSFKEAQKDTGFVSFDAHIGVIATIHAYFAIPKGHYKYHKKTNTTDLDKSGLEMLKDRVKPTKKPDCDNIAKICLDALNGFAYVDDSQVVGLSVVKHYSKEPCVVIKLEEYIPVNEQLY